MADTEYDNIVFLHVKYHRIIADTKAITAKVEICQ